MVRVKSLLVLAGLLTVLTPSGAIADQTALKKTPWRFGGLSPSGRTLRIVAEVHGCYEPATPLVRTTSTTVTVIARNASTADPPDDQSGCPDTVDFDTRLVSLPSPLAGRRLRGAGTRGGPLPGEGDVELVPPVVGLSLHDAREALLGRDVRPRITRRGTVRGLTRVIAQRGSHLRVATGTG